MRKCTRVFLLAMFSFVWVSSFARESLPNDRYVVVLSMDAFRWDYPDKYETPTIDSIGSAGVMSRFIPCFPSLTFPNHYSMATGLHPDKHGLVHNAFYDRKQRKGYRLSDRSAVEDPSFYGGEPIWVTAEKQGVRTASFYWVGSETKIDGIQPTDWKKFDSRIKFQTRADSVISWLKRPEETRPKLVMWYLEEPDAVSHTYTPEGEQTRQTIQQIDTLLGRFFSAARELSFYDKIDFILVGDHGMATYYPGKYVNLGNYLRQDKFTHIASGPVIGLYPDSDYLEEAYTILQSVPNIRVWKKAELPERFNYGKHDRVGELVVLADPGTTIHFSDKDAHKIGAAHGYDPAYPDMHAIFYAAGPSFKQGFRQAPMVNVNLYGIIASILGLKPAPNDGDPVLIRKMMVSR